MGDPDAAGLFDRCFSRPSQLSGRAESPARCLISDFDDSSPLLARILVGATPETFPYPSAQVVMI